MRVSIVELFKKVVLFQYDLPHGNVGKSNWTTIDNDKCYASTSDAKMAQIIYESIIDYAFNDDEISESKNLNELQREAIRTRVRFETQDLDATKERYGLYGEVLFNVLLCALYDTAPIIAKGYFYDILHPEENKGYDSFHVVKTPKSTGLWFGEMKFHQSYRTAIDSVFANIGKALSNDYFRTNLLAFLPKKNDLNDKNDEQVKGIIADLRRNPDINISDLQHKYNLKLIYPICIMCNKETDYDSTIAMMIDYINAHPLEPFHIDVPLEIFFILLPIDDAKAVKKQVIGWIESNQPLTLL